MQLRPSSPTLGKGERASSCTILKKQRKQLLTKSDMQWASWDALTTLLPALPGPVSAYRWYLGCKPPRKMTTSPKKDLLGSHCPWKCKVALVTVWPPNVNTQDVNKCCKKQTAPWLCKLRELYILQPLCGESQCPRMPKQSWRSWTLASSSIGLLFICTRHGYAGWGRLGWQPFKNPVCRSGSQGQEEYL